MQAYGHEGTRAEERRTRRYVQVIASFDTDGRVLPRCVVWPDGRTYAVDEIVDVRQMASTKAGGAGTCYDVRIGRTVTRLFKEDSRWFVEAKPQGFG